MAVAWPLMGTGKGGTILVFWEWPRLAADGNGKGREAHDFGVFGLNEN